MVGDSWGKLLQDEFAKDYFQKLEGFVRQEYQTRVIYPSAENLFYAYRMTPYENVKAVIVGQDPYHQPNQAHGLAFSVKENTPFPPSLRNIFTELKNDLGIPFPKSGDLTKWAKEGVLLINTILTVRESQPGSHKNCGWAEFTSRVIELLNQKRDPVVFILWGNDAKGCKTKITNPVHCILEGAHPSPLSAYNGFFGGRYFSRCNQFLKEHGIKEIDWDLSK